MESLHNIQEDIFTKINKAKLNFKKSPKDRLTVSYIETRLEYLEQLWSLFTSTHTQILSQVKRSDLLASDYHKTSVYDKVEDLFIEFKTDLKEMLAKAKIQSDSFANLESNGSGTAEISGSSRAHVRLPEIKIPVFSGKYIEWQTFRDLFLGLVHENKSLDDAQKLYYLKGHLTGEAELLLKNVQVTAENYKICWEKLDSVYNNKRFLANGILKRLLNQKGLSSESANDIKKLISTTSDCLESVRNLGVDVSSWDILIIHIISAKLDRDTRKAWELKAASEPSDNLPTFKEFSEFLTGRYRGLEGLDSRPVPDRPQKGSQSFHITNNKKEVSCPYCSAGHALTNCKKFLKESSDTRRDFVWDKYLCFLCLKENHSARFCKNTVKCQVCRRRHHSLLHTNTGSGSADGGSCMGSDKPSSTVLSEESTKEGNTVHKVTAIAEGSTKPLVSCFSTGNCKGTVLLPTALVNAESKDGTFQVVRALLDQGSQGSFITEATAQYLGLRKIPTRHTVTGVGNERKILSKSMVTLKLRSRMDPTFEVKVKAFVLKSITSLLPVMKVTEVEWSNLDKDELADPEYYRPNKVDILLGADILGQVIQEGFKKSIGASVIAQATAFGWILSGVGDTEGSSSICSHTIVMHASVESDASSDDMLKKFWELEADPLGRNKILTAEEAACEEFFTKTTRRDENGRYIVRLPFRDADPDCKRGESRSIALRRFNNLEVKLQKDDKLKEEYTKVIHEYRDLKHIEKVPKNDENNKEAVYLPHHAVVREDKATTKIRVVLDASCKGKNGVSLNDNLMVGPTLQAELRHTIMRWRKHPICLVADIIKMYRQVWVDRRDTAYQRILWRDSSVKKIEEYELVTVAFGTSSAPYLAVRALHQLAHDESHNHPTAANIILNDFYMDDLMTGAENIEDGYNIYVEMNAILKKGGFELQKWVSNSDDLVNRLREEIRGKEEELKIKLDNIVKVLGLTWNPRTDVFHYSVDLPPLDLEPGTKRKVISDISRLYDPLGWLAPSIVLAKVFIQKLWLAGIGWDQEVPSDLLDEWITYRKELESLVDVQIPRWVSTDSSNSKVELHGFSDASKMAYSAVVYIRVKDSDGIVHVSLVSAKTKVAPIKQVSIPRLELCGAVLLAKLITEVAEVMAIPKAHLHAWTDSEVVLAWLSSHPSRWKTFVANRVAEILLTLDTHHWSHVPSKHNPADCASRGVSPAELRQTAIWFEGPEFLRQPVVKSQPKKLVTNLEEVKVHLTSLDVTIWNRFSTLSKLLRVIAYCRRFLNLRKDAVKHSTIYLKPEEIEKALEICIMKCQEEEFSKELNELKTTGNLEQNGKKIKSLNVFLDSAGIIRVGGRLEMSQLDYCRKHPILMPKESFLTKLVIADAHFKTLHGGPQIMINYLRSKYWILGAKNLVKAHVRRCVKCIRFSDKTRTQLMGQLPSPRVTPNKVFLSSGVDYAGPINIRVSKGRGNKSYKGYIALFICMSTRAVHLEAVSDLTTKGFLAAYKRFISRRGRCAELYSDNGSNFVGAARELLGLFDEERSSIIPELAEYLASNGTQWHFIPPHAPNFGGLWEAAIKSTKYHLKRVIGNSTLTFEEMTTVLAQIEACLNSRPLSYVENPNELTVLTPGHFLVGEPLVLVPDSNYEKSNIQTLRRWQLTQRMLQDFWRRWSQDYLHQFLQRHKWSSKNPEPAKGDVVLVKEDNLPPGRWLLGKVLQKHPGPDQITRVVTIKTKDGQVKRPTSKICVLPICD